MRQNAPLAASKNEGMLEERETIRKGLAFIESEFPDEDYSDLWEKLAQLGPVIT
jgi:hypothetical protein